MDEYLNNRQHEILWNLLANPVNNGYSYASDLQNLVTDFPQSGILHALLSHADGGQNRSHAAAYLNPKALYVIVNAPENLPILTDSQIIQQLGDTSDYAGVEHADDLQKEEEHQPNSFTETVEEDSHPHIEPEPEAVFDEISYSPLIAKDDDEQHHIEDKEEAITAEHEHDLYTVESSTHEPVEVQTEENSEPEIIAEPVSEDELRAEIALEENIPDNNAAEEIKESAVEEHEPVEAPIAEENTEPEILAEQVSEEELRAEIAPVEHIEDKYTTVEEEEETIVEEHEPVETPVAEEKAVEKPAESIREDELVTETPSFELAEPPRGIDDDIYDEIVGIEDISFARVAQPSDEPIHKEETPVAHEEASETIDHSPVTETFVQRERALNMDDEAEKLIVGNIAATDYFVFDRAFNERKPAEATENGSPISAPETTTQFAAEAIKPTEENQDVSKYDDDTLPYTFLWWLNKTRKEHAGIYQPFKLDTSQAIRRAGADELQQQYYENIFHLSSVDELDRSTSKQPIEFDPQSKEDRIIKRFIIEEPHITPPSSDKLDTENKARKSAEDQDEFVTETLARIYTDQMLYHKAIITYKKLMLKFPEKSRYFADQIEQLENKTN